MSRRNDVAHFPVQPTTHTGLWLDRYLPNHAAGTGQAFVAEVSSLTRDDATQPTSSTSYVEFFKRWKTGLLQAGVTEINMREAKAQNRLAVGLGGEAVLETGITLHRTYGVPYIPGSALKGVASSYAHKRLEGATWRKGKDAHTILFGDTKTAGYVTFFDALYVPGSGTQNDGKAQALWPDVITVHHPNYYAGKKDSAPADWDSPTPVPFLTATGSYLIALQGDDAWVNLAFEILAKALAVEGIGAKTSSGYGRMSIEGISSTNGTDATSLINGTDATSPGESAESVEQADIGRFAQRLEQMPNDKVAGEIHAIYEDWQALETSEQAKRSIAQAILDKIEAAKRTKKSADKAWYKALQEYVTAA
ncbi:MAG: type III-B CRISPR module RAMP protein Cmr6 [Caldilineaceae bacterium]